MKEIRIGVIGCIVRGEISDMAQDAANGVRVVAGADIYQEAREMYAARFKEKFPNDPQPTLYSDYREMIEKEALDGVFITTPDFLHEEMAVFALEHHVAVYLEKPMAITKQKPDKQKQQLKNRNIQRARDMGKEYVPKGY